LSTEKFESLTVYIPQIMDSRTKIFIDRE